MAFLEYSDRDTIIHRLSPVTKLTIFTFFILVSGIWWDFRYLLPLFALSLLWYHLSKVPNSWLKIFGGILLFATPFTVWLGIWQTDPALFTTYPYEFVSKVIFTISTPLGVIGLTYGNCLWIVGWVLKWSTIMLCAGAFVYTCSPSQVSLILTKYVHYALGYIYEVIMRFVPILQKTYKDITSIQKLRGWDMPPKYKLHKLPSAIRPIMKPYLSHMFLVVDRISNAAQSKGFGAKGITVTGGVNVSKKEKVFSIVVVSVIVIILLLLKWNVGQI